MTTNLKYLAFSNHAVLTTVNVSERTRLLSTAVALALSRTLSLPSTENDGSYNYFRLNCEETARQVLSKFNEQVILDCVDALELTRKFWTLRYFAVHPTQQLPATSPYGFFDVFFHVGDFVEENVYAFANQYKRELSALVNEVNSLVTELLQSNA